MNMQSVGLLFELKVPLRSEHSNRRYLQIRAGCARPKRMNDSFSIARPRHFNCIEGRALRSKGKVLGGVVRSLGIVERSSHNLGRALAVYLPRPRAVDRIAVHFEPRAYREKYLLYLVRNRAIGTRTDIHQQVAILAHNVAQLVDDKLRRLAS